MDMFMDKLTQKLTAQEIIKANTAADTEELNKLRNQVAEYNECLVKLQKLLEDAEAKIQAPQVEAARINRLVDESIEKIKEVQRDSEAMEELSGQLEALGRELTEKAEQAAEPLEEKFNFVADSVHKECVKVYRNVQSVVLEESNRQSDERKALSRRLSTVFGISIAAVLFSLISMILQLLTMFNIRLF